MRHALLVAGFLLAGLGSAGATQLITNGDFAEAVGVSTPTEGSLAGPRTTTGSKSTTTPQSA
jgi:hypothetical protein